MVNITLPHTISQGTGNISAEFYQPLINFSNVENLPAILISLLAQLVAAWWLYSQYSIVRVALIPFLKRRLALPDDVCQVFALLFCPAIWGALAFIVTLASGYPIGYQILGIVPLLYGFVCFVRSFVTFTRSSRNFLSRKTNVPFFGITLLWSIFAATPQWIYDQFNYHLAVPRLAMNWGNPATAMVDGHLFATGLFEFSIVPLWSFCFGEVFSSAVAQSYCFFIIFTGLWFTTAFALRRFNSAAHQLFLINMVLLGSLPDLHLAYIFKPDGILIIVFLLCFTLFATATAWNISTFLLCAALAMSFKNVALHGLLVLALVSVTFLWRSFRHWPSWTSITVACLLSLPLWIFRIREGGTPFYPADAIIWPQLLPPGVAEMWALIAHPIKETGLERWSGLPKFLCQIPLLTTAIVFMSISWAYLCRSQHRRFSFRKKDIGLLAFLAIYLATWPLFYYSGIYSRFLAPLTAFALFIFIYIGSNVNLFGQKWFPFLAFVLLANSGTDVKFAKLSRFWHKSGVQLMLEQEPTLAPIRWSHQHLKIFNKVVSSRPEKYFFPGVWLYGVNSWASYDWAEQIRAQLDGGDLVSSIDAVIVPKDYVPEALSYDRTGFTSFLASSLIPYCERNWRKQEFAMATLYYAPTNLKSLDHSKNLTLP